jgi:DNA-binding HxlR family transcriptional regulator
MFTMPKLTNSHTEYLDRLPTVKFKTCPIEVTIRILGKKWTLLILRDIALLKISRFNQIRRSLPGLTPRVLIMRLHELEECGVIQATVIKDVPRIVKWSLTEKGKDTVPILLSTMSFGAKWYAQDVFEDSRARSIEQIYADAPPSPRKR